MAKQTFKTAVIVIVIGTLLGFAYLLGRSDYQVAEAAETSPVGTVDDRDVYYPGTEAIGPAA